MATTSDWRCESRTQAWTTAGQDNALVPQWRGQNDPRARITLDQLLRMTSGLRFTENHSDPLEDVALMLFARRDAAAYAIDKPLQAPPGTRWSYSSGTSNILAAVMRPALALGGPDGELTELATAVVDGIDARLRDAG